MPPLLFSGSYTSQASPAGIATTLRDPPLKPSDQAPLQGLPWCRANSRPLTPVMLTCPAPALLKQAIHSPNQAQPIDHIPTTSRRPVVIISNSHQCQSFHKDLHKPLNGLVLDGLEEIQTLGRTLTERASDTPGLLRPPPYLQRPHARPSTGAWSTYAASPWAFATSPTTPSAASSTPEASKTT